MKKQSVGDVAPAFSFQEIQEAIDRAYAYWDTAHVVGGYLTKHERADRIAYLDSLSTIQEKQREVPVSLQQLGLLRDWQQDKNLAALVGNVLGFSPGYYNLMKVVASATPEEVEYWSLWYHHAHDDVVRLAKEHNRLRRTKGLPSLPLTVVAAIVAVLSPNNVWRLNLAAADYLLTFRSGIGTSAFPANVRKALYMLQTWDTSPVSGPKVTVFHGSLCDPKAYKAIPVLDGHMMNLWRGERRNLTSVRTPTNSERKQMIVDCTQAAFDSGMQVQDMQALAWYIWKFTEEESPLPPRRVIAETQEMFKADFFSLRANKLRAKQRATEYLKEAADKGEIGSKRSRKVRMGIQENRVIVGAKSKWNDLLQPPATLVKLAKKNPRAYTNPNMPFSALLDGAKIYPWYVESNPALTMLSLEDPASYASLMEELVAGWRNAGVRALSEPSQRLYACDCAEQVLPKFEAMYPDDERPQEAIAVARRFALGQATSEELIAASVSVDYKAYRSTYSVSEAAYEAYYAAYASVRHAEVDISRGEIEERVWQANRVRYYYALEHPDYQPPQAVGLVIHSQSKVRSRQSRAASSCAQTGTMVIGARSLDDIRADLQATPEEIRALAMESPLWALQHPNCHAGLWWPFAETYPVEAFCSIPCLIYPLENPSRWREIVARADLGMYMRNNPQWITPQIQVEFDVECLSSVAEIYQGVFPKSKKLSTLLALMRQFTEGKITRNALESAQEKMNLGFSTTKKGTKGHEDSAARIILLAATAIFGCYIPSEVQRALVTRSGHTWDSEEGQRLRDGVGVWQWNLFLDLMAKHHIPLDQLRRQGDF